MTTFAAGDRVHVPGLGTGTVREARNGGRYLIEIKGRTLVVDGSTLEKTAAAHRPKHGTEARQEPRVEDLRRVHSGPDVLDLHGKTVPEAIEALDGVLNDW